MAKENTYVWGNDPAIDNTGPEDCKVPACISATEKFGYALAPDQKPDDEIIDACNEKKYECYQPSDDVNGYSIRLNTEIEKISGVPLEGDMVCRVCNEGVVEPIALESIASDRYAVAFPGSIVKKASDVLSMIPGLPKIELKDVTVSGGGKDCCTEATGLGKAAFANTPLPGRGEGDITFGATIGMTETCWRWWPVIGKCSGKKPFKFFEVKNPFTDEIYVIEAIIEGGLIFDSPIDLEGNLGGSWNECNNDAYCLKGSLGIKAIPTLKIVGEAISCFSITDTKGNRIEDNCAGGGLTGSAQAEFFGGLSYNGCDLNPWSGNGFTFKAIATIEAYFTISGDKWKLSHSLEWEP